MVVNGKAADEPLYDIKMFNINTITKLTDGNKTLAWKMIFFYTSKLVTNKIVRLNYVDILWL